MNESNEHDAVVDGADVGLEGPEPIQSSRTGRRDLGYVVVAALLTVAALFALVTLLPLPFGSLAAPGPGLWPVSIAALTVVLCLCSLWFNHERYEPVTRQQLKVGAAAAGCLAFLPLAGLLGFIPASVLVLMWLLKLVGGESWLVASATAVITSIAVYLIFAVALALPIDAF